MHLILPRKLREERTNMQIEFLNCNYPNEYKVPKGKPKEIKASFEIKKGSNSLIVNGKNEIWLKEGSFYMGIRFEPARGHMFDDIKAWKTINEINMALYNWCEIGLTSDNENLIQIYLKIIS